MRFQNKFIVLGVTGGIAIYKAADLLRRLIQEEGAAVQVIMTSHAQAFMTPLIFETLSGKPVITDMFQGPRIATRHIDLAESADVVLVCPATANCLAKAAQGSADDMLSTVILTAGNKTCFVPAMNTAMWLNPITQANVTKLRQLGYGILEPDEGPLACQAVGKGRLPAIDTILAFLDHRLNGRRSLLGKKVVVTAGPTRAPIDAVRFITNRSSGKMGYALASMAVREGAEVLLISGPTSLPVPWGVRLQKVETADDLQSALISQGKDADYLFMAAAVEDIVPEKVIAGKLKKESGFAPLEVKAAPDIVQSYRRLNPNTCIIGFSVEIEQGEERSLAKMRQKGLDYIVWNDPSQPGAGFEHETNAVTLFAADGRRWELGLASKREIAAQIIAIVAAGKDVS